MARHINVHYTDKRGILDQTPCPHEGCTCAIDRNTIETVTDNNKAILAAYDEVRAERKQPQPKKPVELDEESKKLIEKIGARPCPKCRTPFLRTDGCNHMVCKCGHEFCFICLANYPGYRHAAPDCGAGTYGNAPGMPGNAVDNDLEENNEDDHAGDGDPDNDDLDDDVLDDDQIEAALSQFPDYQPRPVVVRPVINRGFLAELFEAIFDR